MSDKVLLLAAMAVVTTDGPHDPRVSQAVRHAVRSEYVAQRLWLQTKAQPSESMITIAGMITRLDQAMRSGDPAAAGRAFRYLREAVGDYAQRRLEALVS
ncbi:hypothetical protein [Chachezhania sediminis]|uniref:hypothetical protein n=1 Tax=Chachezhania sediminis TaxID=2599291 RepID=UPI00131BA96B|nr:hypothetical protein [Chachezhania sediminis]